MTRDPLTPLRGLSVVFLLLTLLFGRELWRAVE